MKKIITKKTKTQYKMSMILNNKYFIKIDFLNTKISLTYNVLTSFKKAYKSPLIMFLEDFQFR